MTGIKSKVKKKNQFDGYFVYGTRNFNEKTGRNSYADNTLKYIRDYFIDPKTGLLYEHMAENRDCPICETNDCSILFIKDGFQHVKCTNCSFIYVNPTLSDKYRDHFLDKVSQAWTEVLLYPEQEFVDTYKFKYGLHLTEKYIDKKGVLVDIGAGSGLFLKIARDAGWKVSGVEFNQKGVENIRKLGIEVFDKPLEEGIYASDSVDVVSIWEVLEHINYPSVFLQQIFKILKPGGLLFICVPNINALVTRILHEKARTFGKGYHVSFFSINTLSRLIEKNGFKVLETDTIISELGTIKNYLSYEDPYSGGADLDLDFLTPEYLYKNELGSRIIMLCKKGQE